MGPAIDAFLLWQCCRFTYLFFSLVVFHPPLSLGIPIQLLAVSRAMRAGFCTATILQHEVMQQRTGALVACPQPWYVPGCGLPLTVPPLCPQIPPTRSWVPCWRR